VFPCYPPIQTPLPTARRALGLSASGDDLAQQPSVTLYLIDTVTGKCQGLWVILLFVLHEFESGRFDTVTDKLNTGRALILMFAR